MKLLIVIVSYRVTDLTIDCLCWLDGKIGRGPGHPGRPLRERHRRRRRGATRRAHRRERLGPVGKILGRSTRTRGFTGGNNAVIRPAGVESDDPPEYVLLLNADTIVGAARPGLAGRIHGRPPQGRSRRQPPPLARTARPRGSAHSASRGSRPSWTAACGWASSRSCCRDGTSLFPKSDHPCRVNWWPRRQHDPPPVDARPDRPARRGPLHLLRRLRTSACERREPAGRPGLCRRAGWSTSRGSTGITTCRVQPVARATVSKRAAGICSRIMAMRTRPWSTPRSSAALHLAATATGPSQARNRPALHAERFDPAQRLRHGSRSRWPRTRRCARRRCVRRGPRDPRRSPPAPFRYQEVATPIPPTEPTEPTLPTSPTGARHLRGAKTPGDHAAM